MEITPSILTADFCELGKVMDDAISAGIQCYGALLSRAGS